MPFNWSRKGSKPEGTEPVSPAPSATPVATAGDGGEAPPVAVHIEAPAKVLVHREGKAVKLPPIVLTSIDPERTAEIVRVTIEGKSDNKPFAEWLTKAYKAAAARVPRKLKQAFSIEPELQDWPADQPIESVDEGGSHAISIRVDHKPLGADGRVGDRSVTAQQTVHVLPGDSLQQQYRLEVTPRHLLKVFEGGGRGVGPQLCIGLRRRTSRPGAHPAAEPTLEIKLTAKDLPLLAAEWGCPGIVGVVESMLRVVAAAAQPSDDGLLIRVVPRLRLTGADSDSLRTHLNKSGAEPLRVPIRIQATGARPVEQLWELHPQGNIQEGLIVFDLGTSTSVSCQFDPNFLEPSVFPREQLAQLRNDVAEFLATPDKEMLHEAESYWLRLLRAVASQCGLGTEGDPARALASRLSFTISSERGAEEFYELLRHLELQLWTLDTLEDKNERRKLLRFQERVASRLHSFYEMAFEKMPLAQWNIRLCRPEGESDDFVISELELISLEPLPTGVLSRRSAERRLKWLTGREEPAALGAVREGRFLECPKRFLPHIHEARDLTELGAWPVTQTKEGSEVAVELTARQALQASWQCLIDAAQGVKRPGQRGIDQVAVTYPADLMPEPRSQMDQALRELGMVTVHLDFDESISPAIFHLEKLFGNMEEIGCEAFKVQCVREGTIWVHHMLVLDIGAGTTDISLIRLEMRERLPDRSEFGGRLYEITPRLLGAAGRSQSGGHQLTLKIFRVLKRLLATWIRGVETRTGDEPAEPAARSYQAIPEAELDDVKGDNPALSAALEAAEKVLPTRFHDLLTRLRSAQKDGTAEGDLTTERQRLERFTLLWKWAEELKVHLSQLIDRTPEELPRGVPLDAFKPADLSWLKDTMEALLSGTSYVANLADLMNPSLHRIPDFSLQDFHQLAQSATEHSVKLATGMAASALENYGLKLGDEFDLTLQSVVLSGRACALPEVQKQLRRQLRQPRLGGGKAKIWFRNEYAKSATAIGACRAQRRIANARPHLGAPQRLEGKCEMDIRIENLFFYLPASYHLGTAGNELGLTVFERHAEFKQFGPTPLGVIRSGGSDKVGDHAAARFVQPSREMLIFRNDGDGNGVLQGGLVVQNLVADRSLPNRRLGAECATWGVRFEINHRRQLSALLIRPSAVAGVAGSLESIDPIYDVGSSSADPLTVVDLDKVKRAGLLSAAKQHCPVHIYAKPPGPHAQPLLSAEQMSGIRCVSPTVIAPASRHSSAPAVKATPSIIRGWLSPVLSGSQFVLPNDGRVTLYLVDARTNKEVQSLTVEPRPKDPDNPDRIPTKFPFSVGFRIALTADGRFALLIGDEAPYWETTDVDEWLIAPEGRVLRRELEPPPQTVPWWRDPFCGKH